MEDEEDEGRIGVESEVPIERFGDWGFNASDNKSETYSSDGDARQLVEIEGTAGQFDDFPLPEGDPAETGSTEEGQQQIEGLPDGFSLIEFVKKELRLENQAELRRYKEELREQVMGALREEAGAILHTFSSNVLETVQAPIPWSSKRAYIPVDPLAKARAIREAERRGPARMRMESRVASGIVEGMKAALGPEEVNHLLEPIKQSQQQDSPSYPIPFSRLRPRTTGGQSRVHALSDICASSYHQLPAASSSSSHSEIQEWERIGRYIAGSPLHPDHNNRKPPKASFSVHQQRQSRTSFNPSIPLDSDRVAEYRGDSERQENGEGQRQEQEKYGLDERTTRLLGQTEKLLGDVQRQPKRTQTSIGGSRVRRRQPQQQSLSDEPQGIRQDEARTGTTTSGRRPSTVQQRGGRSIRTRGSGNSITNGAFLDPFPPEVKKWQQDRIGLTEPNAAQQSSLPSNQRPVPVVIKGKKATPAITNQRRPKTSNLSGRPGSSVQQIKQLRKAKLMDDLPLKREGEEHLPVKLGDEEWENEVARNVLTLYVSSMKQREDAAAAARDEANAAAAVTSRLVDEEQEEGKRQRQRPSTTMTGLSPSRGRANKPIPAAANSSSPSRNSRSNKAAAGSGVIERTSSYDEEEGGGGPDVASMIVTASSCSTIDDITQSLSFAIEKGRPKPKFRGGETREAYEFDGGKREKEEDEMPRRPGTTPKMIHSVGHSRMVVDRRNGGKGLVFIPRLPKTIWFAGSGTNKAEWSSVPGTSWRMIERLRVLNDKGEFSKYVDIIETLLLAVPRTASSASPAGNKRVVSEIKMNGGQEKDKQEVVMTILWRQLIATVNSFAARCIEVRRFASALQLLNKASTLLELGSPGTGGAPIATLDRSSILDLQAYILDTYAHYYHVRGKQHAALNYVQKAMKIHAKRQNWKHVAICHLHSSVILAKLGKTSEGLRCMTQVLHMVESGDLELDSKKGATNMTQMIALVSVCYHNMAVMHVVLRNLGEAFMCSQNGRRLARLSLNYTNRWAEMMEGTHKIVVCELACKYKYVEKVFQNKDQEALFEALLHAMGSAS